MLHVVFSGISTPSNLKRVFFSRMAKCIERTSSAAIDNCSHFIRSMLSKHSQAPICMQPCTKDTNVQVLNYTGIREELITGNEHHRQRLMLRSKSCHRSLRLTSISTVRVRIFTRISEISLLKTCWWSYSRCFRSIWNYNKVSRRLWRNLCKFPFYRYQKVP